MSIVAKRLPISATAELFSKYHKIVISNVMRELSIRSFICKYLTIGLVVTNSNKSSDVAETGDRLATIDMGQKAAAIVPLSVVELGPHLTQCRLG